MRPGVGVIRSVEVGLGVRPDGSEEEVVAGVLVEVTAGDGKVVAPGIRVTPVRITVKVETAEARKGK